MTRLLMCSAFNLMLVLLALRLAVEGVGGFDNVERDIDLNLIAGVVAGVALVVVAPVLWKGKMWEIIFACLLAVRPGVTLYSVYEFSQELGGLSG